MNELEQLERLRSEDTPRRLMITHTIDQFILLTSLYRIPSQNKVKAEKVEKLVKNWNMEIIDLELKTSQSGHNFQSQGRMTLKI